MNTPYHPVTAYPPLSQRGARGDFEAAGPGRACANPPHPSFYKGGGKIASRN
jgi:hypothetical protein